MSKDYKLIHLWGLMMGSDRTYIEEQRAQARADKAPQTAMFWTSPKNNHTHRTEYPVPGRTDKVWALYDEYLPAEPRKRMDAKAQQVYSQTLSSVLKEIGFEERVRQYADVAVDVRFEVDVEAWMTEYGVDRALALEQIRNDLKAHMLAALSRDTWDSIIDHITVRIGVEA